MLIKPSHFLIFSMLTSYCLMSVSGCEAHKTFRSSVSGPLDEVINLEKQAGQTSTIHPFSLPAAVGLLFVPGIGYQEMLIPDPVVREITEKLKDQLLTNPKYIKSVSLIPVDDLDKIALEQIQTAYNLDIIILVAYQQDQSIEQIETLSELKSIADFLIPSVNTKTSTSVDGKMLQISKNTVMLKAIGTDERSSSSTKHSMGNSVTNESIDSLQAAASNFGETLSQALTQLETYDSSQAESISTIMPKKTGPFGRAINTSGN